MLSSNKMAAMVAPAGLSDPPSNLPLADAWVIQ